MGTSRNDRSPSSPPWRPVQAVLGRKDIGTQRQMQELWLAAFADRGERLIGDFTKPAMVDLLRVAAANPTPQAAIRAFDDVVGRHGDAGLALDFARRALVRNAAARGGLAGFASELFSEASGYYASRDLPSFVGAENRVPNSSGAIELKNAIRVATQDAVGRVGVPTPDRSSWLSYVSDVIDHLKGAR
jgi:hypothetical protein